MASGEMTLRTSSALGSRSEAAPVEAGLLAQCRRGDAEAFARLVGLHERMVFNLAARLLGNPEDARDLSQEVFLQVYRTIGSFEGRSSLKTWIYRIVVNRSRNRQRWWRRRRRDASCGLEDLTPSEQLEVARGSSGSLDPHEQVVRRERAELVQKALLQVSFDHRAILLLREVEGLSCEEMATALGIAEGTVKSRLARAREALRLALTKAP